jgi:hypothetical protein
MTNPHLNAVHRLTVLRKLEALNPPPATNAGPKFQPPQVPVDPMHDLRQAGANLDRRLVEARTLLASLKTSKTPVATARRVETIARKAAADLSAARREAAKPAVMTAESYLAPLAKPTMTRAEFSALPHGERGKAIKTITLVP